MSWQEPLPGQRYPPQGYPPQGYPPQAQPQPGCPPQQPVYGAPPPNPPSMMNNTTIINNTPAPGAVKPKISLIARASWGTLTCWISWTKFLFKFIFI